MFIFFLSSFGAAFDPAKQTMIKMIIPKEKLTEAISLSQLSVNSMKIIAPATGGALLIFLSPQKVLVIEIVLLLLSALILSRIKAEPVKEFHHEEKLNLTKEIMLGFKHIFSNKQLSISILLMSLGLFFVFLYDSLLVLWSKQIGFEESDFGLFLSMIGLGAVIGSLIMGKWGKWRKNPVVFMCLAGITSGTFIILLGMGGIGILKLHTFTWVIIVLLIGILGGTASVPYGYVIQTETTSQLIGRVSAAGQALITFSMLIAPALGATLANLFGVGYVFLISGIASCLSAIIFYLLSNTIQNKRN
ncbi:MFS transporter [Bacillus carboniphilus]|uniref:MFS transporter n=1 Tax=Bacillus carboniphilus TaxID=86663 RepID=A0ABY9JXG8_9BACI|nr:MFS transporter [Bacillus carboniphilus]WLR43217.1 MFS transporter [Bacillus carboniphilus]